MSSLREDDLLTCLQIYFQINTGIRVPGPDSCNDSGYENPFTTLPTKPKNNLQENIDIPVR